MPKEAVKEIKTTIRTILKDSQGASDANRIFGLAALNGLGTTIRLQTELNQLTNEEVDNLRKILGRVIKKFPL